MGTTTSTSAGRFQRQLTAHLLAHVIDRAATQNGVGTGEIDVFENAGPGGLAREGPVALDAFIGNHHHFAILDFAHETGADDVERTGFRAQDVGAVQFTQHERADAERIARADQLLVGERDEGIGTFKTAQRVDVAFDDACCAASAPRDAGSLPCRRWTGRWHLAQSVRGAALKPLVRLPLWATAKPPAASSAKSGWTLRRMVSPVVE